MFYRMKYCAQRCLVLFAVTAVLACAGSQSTPVSRFYVLDALPSAQVKSLKPEVVKFAPVIVPEYLQQPFLVTRVNLQEIRVANYHSWADNLAASVRRVLMSRLEQTSARYSFVEDCELCPRLDIFIDHFYPTSEGSVVLSGRFEFDREDSITRERFSFVAPIQEPGFEHAVNLMSALLGDLSVQIKDAVD